MAFLAWQVLFFSPPAGPGRRQPAVSITAYRQPARKIHPEATGVTQLPAFLRYHNGAAQFAPRQRIGNTTMKKMFAALLVSAGLLSGGIAAAQDTAAAPAAPAAAAPAAPAAAPAPKAHHAKHHHKKHHAKKTAHKAKKHHKKKAKA
jgi:hypothetical protein